MEAEKPVCRVIEFKLYPSASQGEQFERWMSTCRWVHNQALEYRIKAYKRRKEVVGLYKQQVWLTKLRAAKKEVGDVPAWFLRGSLDRVDKAYKRFFNRVSSGDKKVGFPRFKSASSYRSISFGEKRKFIQKGKIFVPGMGSIRAKGRIVHPKRQIALRIIRRATGWHAQIVVEIDKPNDLAKTGAECGIDLGLESFATMDDGGVLLRRETIRKNEKMLRRANKMVSRCKNGSNRREKAKKRLAKVCQRIQRKNVGFCHRVSRLLVNKFDRIAIEDLNIRGLASGMLSKHVLNACWGRFVVCLTYKAEEAGRVLVKVDPRGTSQECPACGRIAPKKLSEREHHCSGCGLRCHRDHAAARVVRQRAFRPVRGEPVSPGTEQAGSLNRKNQATAIVQ